MSDRVVNGYTGVKLFSATKAADRERLGETVTGWLNRNPVTVVDTVVRQSSDNQFHCVTIILFYRD